MWTSLWAGVVVCMLRCVPLPVLVPRPVVPTIPPVLGPQHTLRQAVWELLRDGAILRAVDLSAVPSLRFPTSLLSASSILRSATLPATTPVFKSAIDDADADVGLPGTGGPPPSPPYVRANAALPVR